MTLQEEQERYRAAAHAMQTGVQMVMNYDPTPTSKKHLRVGINTAHSNHAALAKLLIERGVIRESEYFKAIGDQMEVEKGAYEDRVNEHFNPDGRADVTPISLG